MIQKFTEIYREDAKSLARYLAEREQTEIIITQEESEGFPLPPKHKSLPERVNAYKVGDYKIAYLERERPEGEDLKYRNRNLYRVMIGDKIFQARFKAGVSLAKLSALTGIRERNLENIEAGRFDVSIDTLYNIAAALGFDVVLMPK